MEFLLDILALLGATAVVLVLAGLGLASLPRAAAIALAAVATVAFWGEAWPTIKAVDQARDEPAKLTDAEARVRPAAINGVNVAFLDWVRTHLRPGDTFALVPEGDAAGAWVRPWSAYYLLPHQITEPAEADWLVLYGTKDAGPQKARFERPKVLAPGFAIAEARGAD